MKDIVIYGAGGQCYALIELIRSTNKYNPIKVLDIDLQRTSILGVPVELESDKEDSTNIAAIAIGNNRIRKRMAGSLKKNTPAIIHHSAVVYPSVSIERGVLVHPNAVLDADVTVGKFTIINNNATVSHNCKIGAYSHVAINAAIAGGCEIGEGVLLGVGCIVLPNVKIGNWATIGAGAVITKNVPDGVTVIGNPMRILRS
ncbi:MAG: acetyltransferase [Marinirhabdus sp.]|nr:acetyltransferase [Marinirhabdus sp.]